MTIAQVAAVEVGEHDRRTGKSLEGIREAVSDRGRGDS